MDDIVYPVERAVQPLFIPHIANEKTDTRITLELLCHVPLLHFIPAVDDDFFRVIFGKSHRDKSISEGTGTTGDQNC